MVLAIVTGSASGDLVAAGELRQALFSSPDRTGFTLRPDGSAVAFLAMDGDRVGLWLAPVDHPTQVRPLVRAAGQSIFQYQWAANGRAIVYQTGLQPAFPQATVPPEAYALYLASPDGGKFRQLTGPLDRRVRLFASPLKPGTLFVSPSRRLPAARTALRLDLDAGRVLELPGNAGLGPVYPDMDLEPRLALRPAPLGGQELMLRAADGAWRSLRTYTFAEYLQLHRVVFEQSGRYAHLVHAGPDDRAVIERLDLRSGAFTPVAAAPGEDIIDVLAEHRSGRLLAYLIDGAPARWVGLDPGVTRDLDRLRMALGPGELRIIDQSIDGGRWLVRYETDTRPAGVHVFDRDSGRIIFGLPESDARSGRTGYWAARTVSLPARDGLSLSAQLTLPGVPAPGRPFPLVLWVHGGPFDAERWTFDPQAQWLAGLGLAVLRVNFRGSTGHGRRFMEASYGEWGGRMQDDLVDSARWAVKAGIADPQRIAVMGLSYGGFATLNALADPSGTFACGVATAPVTDLNLLLDTVTEYAEGLEDPVLRTEFAYRLERDRRQLGGDNRVAAGRRDLAARSPLARATGIRGPVLVVHGLRDTGVVPAHSERVVTALQGRGVDVTYLTYRDEGHGLTRLPNLLSFTAIVENFLARCLGGTAGPVTRADLAGSSLDVPDGAGRIPGLPAALDPGGAVGEGGVTR